MSKSNYAKILEQFESLGYDAQRTRDGALEQWYYELYGKLPEGHYVIERVEEINGDRLFIHSDPQQRDD